MNGPKIPCRARTATTRQTIHRLAWRGDGIAASEAEWRRLLLRQRHLGQDSLHLVEIDRLDQVVIEPGILRPQDV